MMEITRFLRKPPEVYVVHSRIISTLVLQRSQLVRTFAAKSKTSKKPIAKRKASKKAAAAIEDAFSRNLYPFYTDKGHQTFPTSPITITSNRIEKDNSRFYKVQNDSEIYTFPSVTHVLSCTKPPSFNFAMQRWEDNMAKEHGEKGVQKLKKEIRTRGTNFHKAVGDHLVNMQLQRNVENVKLQCEDMKEADQDTNETSNNTIEVSENTTKTNAKEDMDRTHQHLVSFPDKLREALKGLSQRLTGLFTSVIPLEKEALASSKPDAMHTKTQTSEPVSKQVAKPATKQVKQEDTQQGVVKKQIITQAVRDDTKYQQQLINVLGKLPEGKGLSQSVEHVVNDISEVYAVESVVSHVDLGYVGTVDLVAMYKGEVCVIDWKTSQKPKKKLKDIYDFPEQAIAYVGAINSDKNYPFNVEKAAIVVVYLNGEPADVHMFEREQCPMLWARWLEKLEQYHKMFASDLNEVVDEY